MTVESHGSLLWGGTKSTPTHACRMMWSSNGNVAIVVSMETGEMRRAAKADKNQAEIVSAFRTFGCSVLHLHQVGGGCPDIAVGLNKKTALVEIKDGGKAKSARALTADEQKFHDSWKGSLFVVEDLGDVIALVKGLEK